MRRVYRLIILGLVGASGAGVLSLAKSGSAHEAGLSERYLALVDRDPSRVYSYYSRAIDGCLPESLKAHVGSLPVKNLTIMAYMKSIRMTAEGKGPDEASAEFIPWLTGEAKKVSPNDRKTFLTLVESPGFSDQKVQMCVLADVVARMDDAVQQAIGTWELRL